MSGDEEVMVDAPPLLDGTQASTGFTCDDVIESLGYGRFQWRLLFITGTMFSGDAMQMVLVSFSSPAARCEFSLNKAQEALISSIVFAGMFFGSYICGVLADNYGRRAVFLGSSLVVCFFGMFSAVALSYEMLLLGQFMVGCGIGGVPVAFSLFSEFIPASERGEKLVTLQVFWSLGALSEAALAWIVMPTLGWRWLLFFSALPTFGLLIFQKYVPESPRWQASKGKQRLACETLQNVATFNGVNWSLGDYQDLQVVKASGKEASFFDLFEGGYAKITLVLWTLWLSCTMLYYGVILISTQVFESDHDSSAGGCTGMGAEDYARAFITTVAEVPGLAAAFYLINSLGRKRTLMFSFMGTCVFFIALMFAQGYVWWETASIFGARAAANCAFTVVYISTGEMYPTSIRSTGLGTASAMARLGGFAAPFVAAVLFDASRTAALLTFAGVALATMLVTQHLPESEGQLPDTPAEAAPKPATHLEVPDGSGYTEIQT